jgi:hypothetical protein
MLSIIFFSIFMVLLLTAWVHNWKSKVFNGAAAISGIIAAISLFALWMFPLGITSEITRYEREKTIYYALDLNKLSDLRKIQLLSNLITLDASMRDYKSDNKSPMWDLYIPDEIEQVELVKGWEK